MIYMQDLLLKIAAMTVLWLFMIGVAFWPYVRSGFDIDHPDMKARADLMKMSDDRRRRFRRSAKAGIVIGILLATSIYACTMFIVITQHVQQLPKGPP